MSRCPHCGQPTGAQLALAAATAPERKARRSDPDTSKQAARLAFPRAANQRRRVLECFARHTSGLTVAQAATATGLPYVSTSTRTSELLQGGWLERVPGLTRQTDNGGQAHVLVATDAAHRELRAAA